MGRVHSALSGSIPTAQEAGVSGQLNLASEALKDARRIIANERAILIDCSTLNGALATLGADAGPDLAEYDAALSKIDAALETFP